MALTNMPFGIPGPLKSINKQYSFEELRVKGCDGTYIFYLDGTENFGLERDIYYAYGLECDAGGVSEVVTSVSLSESEEVAGQHKVARNPGDTPGEGRLLKTDYLMVVGLSRSVSVSGMGALPADFEKEDIGRVVGELTFNTKYGTFSIETGGLTVLRDVSETNELTNFHSYSLNMEEFNDATDADALEHMITLDSELEVYTEDFHTRSRSLSLSQEGVPTDSISITNFLAD